MAGHTGDRQDAFLLLFDHAANLDGYWVFVVTVGCGSAVDALFATCDLVAVSIANDCGSRWCLVVVVARLTCVDDLASTIRASGAFDSSTDLDGYWVFFVAAVGCAGAVDALFAVDNYVAICVAYLSWCWFIVAAVGCAGAVDALFAVDNYVAICVAYLSWCWCVAGGCGCLLYTSPSPRD